MFDLVAYVDGGSLGNPGPAGVGVVIEGSESGRITIGKAIGRQDNNVAEYLALLEALQCAVTMKARKLHVYSDSEVVVRQMTGEYNCRSSRLYSLNWTCRKLARSLNFTISYIRREHNAEANSLAGAAARERSTQRSALSIQPKRSWPLRLGGLSHRQLLPALVLTARGIQTFILQPQSFHRNPPDDVRLQISSTSASVTPPYQIGLGIDHEVRPVLALVQASGLVGANLALQPALSQFHLEQLLQFGLGGGIATSARMSRRPLVPANENVALKFRHGNIVQEWRRMARGDILISIRSPTYDAGRNSHAV